MKRTRHISKLKARRSDRLCRMVFVQIFNMLNGANCPKSLGFSVGKFCPYLFFCRLNATAPLPCGAFWAVFIFTTVIFESKAF